MEHLFYPDLLAFSLFDAHQFFLWFCEHAGYWFVFIFMIIESSFIPFPSELIVPPAAYLAVSRGDMNIFMIIIVATGGALVGALFNYYISLWIGRPIVYRFADSRFGHACLITREKVNKAEEYFDRHGAMSTLIGRLIPVVRQLISIPAGLAKMNIYKFIIFTTIGALIWNIILGILGYTLGHMVPFDQLETQIEKYNSYLSWAGFLLLVGVAAFLAYNAAKNKNSKDHN